MRGWQAFWMPGVSQDQGDGKDKEIVINWMQFISRDSDISYIHVGIWYGGGHVSPYAMRNITYDDLVLSRLLRMMKTIP